MQEIKRKEICSGFSERLFLNLWKRQIVVTADEACAAQHSLEMKQQNL
jgi:hypothetical protein